ncbi:MAG: hypothetical protein RJQ00_14100 [Vicingaceae bacterium]|jgi:hypothetical protein
MKNYKMSFLSQKIKPFIHLLILNLMLWGDSYSQSIFDFSPDSTFEYDLTTNFINGIGVAFAGSYSKDEAFAEACKNSLLSLSSNNFLSVFVEIFKQNDSYYFEFPEFSIETDPDSITMSYSDSLSSSFDDDIFCITSNGKQGVPPSINIPELKDLEQLPRKVGNTWFAFGKEPISKYDHQSAWLKAKNNALKNLAKVYSITIKSIEYNVEGLSENLGFTEFKTNILFEDIIVLKRMIIGGHQVVIVVIDESNITSFN